MDYRMRICSQIAEIDQQQWNSLVELNNQGVLHPALRHEFLNALEVSGCVNSETGWTPVHLALEQDNQLVACMPLYLKTHSYGEYVFDWAWAQAYHRHGLAYYPKLLSAIPFTPSLAPKFLAATQQHGLALCEALRQLLRQASNDADIFGALISSYHGLFLSKPDADYLTNDYLERKNIQFHWRNQHPDTGETFKDFNDFLSTLNQKKRKNINAERRKVREADLSIKRYIGQELSEPLLEFFYVCYAKTYSEHHSTPYLSLGFFKHLVATMPENLLLVIAFEGDEPVASSFFLHSSNTLYGRYWGCKKDIKYLHFELCYYQGLEFAIEQKIMNFEGGAQGEHKMARGLNPVTMISKHWVAEPNFKDAIERYLERESEHLSLYVSELNEHSAFKQAQEEAKSI